MRCFKCGASEKEKKLVDAITLKGIVKACEACALEEGLIIINKPTQSQLAKAEKEPERFREKVKKFHKESEPDMELRQQNIELGRLVDRKALEKAQFAKKNPNLVDHFHWILMRKRRAKKISPAELAKEINEPEVLIRLIEKGVLPQGSEGIIDKLERYFGIRLWKSKNEKINNSTEEKRPPEVKKLDFSPAGLKNLTIGDLKKIQKELKNSK